MIRCPVCGKWFTDSDNIIMETHLVKKHNMRITIDTMSYEDIDKKIRNGGLRKI